MLPFIHLPVHMPPASGVGPGQASLLIFQRLIPELLPRSSHRLSNKILFTKSFSLIPELGRDEERVGGLEETENKPRSPEPTTWPRSPEGIQGWRLSRERGCSWKVPRPGQGESCAVCVFTGAGLGAGGPTATLVHSHLQGVFLPSARSSRWSLVPQS